MLKNNFLEELEDNLDDHDIIFHEIYPFDTSIIINEHDDTKIVFGRGNMRGT